MIKLISCKVYDFLFMATLYQLIVGISNKPRVQVAADKITEAVFIVCYLQTKIN